MHDEHYFIQAGRRGPKTSGPGRKEEVEEADSILAAFKDSRKQKGLQLRQKTPQGLKPEQSLFSLSLTTKRKTTFITLSAHFSCHYKELFKIAWQRFTVSLLHHTLSSKFHYFVFSVVAAVCQNCYSLGCNAFNWEKIWNYLHNFIILQFQESLQIQSIAALFVSSLMTALHLRKQQPPSFCTWRNPLHNSYSFSGARAESNQISTSTNQIPCKFVKSLGILFPWKLS